jgi:hypothetical protein
VKEKEKSLRQTSVLDFFKLFHGLVIATGSFDIGDDDPNNPPTVQAQVPPT